MSPASLSTLPKDMVAEILGRVPNYHCRQVVSLVSKKFHDIVRCPGLISQIRRRVGKVSLYLSFTNTSVQEFPRVWYLLRSRVDDPTMNKFVSIQFPDIGHDVRSIITVGPKVFFIRGTRHTATRLSVYDSRSGELRESPVMLVEMRYHSSGLVSGKIYVIGTRLHDPDEEVLAESYDLDTETWEQAPIYEPQARMNLYYSPASASIDDKVYALHCMPRGRNPCYYDTRVGSCEFFESCSYDKLWKTCMCVIDNVLYLYDSKLGLMWYDSTLTQWGEVSGLDLNIVQQSVGVAEYDENKAVGMAEYHGKLAFVWIKPGGGAVNEIWGTRIALARTETGFDGTAEPFQLLGTVPRRYVLRHFFSVLG